MAEADAGETVVSSTVKDLVVGSEDRVRGRGRHHLKGVPGNWRLFAVSRSSWVVRGLSNTLSELVGAAFSEPIDLVLDRELHPRPSPRPMMTERRCDPVSRSKRITAI